MNALDAFDVASTLARDLDNQRFKAETLADSLHEQLHEDSGLFALHEDQRPGCKRCRKYEVSP